jgi:hypothetical protein
LDLALEVAVLLAGVDCVELVGAGDLRRLRNVWAAVDDRGDVVKPMFADAAAGVDPAAPGPIGEGLGADTPGGGRSDPGVVAISHGHCEQAEWMISLCFPSGLGC